MKKSYILSAFLLLLVSAVGLRAQSNDRILEPGGRPILLGIFGGADYNIHNGEFYTTQDGIVCCRFENGSGFGGVGGVKAMIPLGESVSLMPRVLYENRGGTFISREENYPILGENNRIESVTFENRLDVALHSVTVDALGSYTVAPFGLYLAAGPSVSIVAGQSFSKTISIYSPTGVRFLDGSTSKTIDPGEQDIVEPLQISARAGVGAVLQVSDGIYVNPEVLYTVPLGNVAKQDQWTIGGVQGTVGVMVAW